MAEFNTFANRLPDPVYGVAETGENVNATANYGPGFATVKVTSEQPISVSTTNSGRTITRSVAAHRWKIAITYNPMTRDDFEPIYNFLMERRGRLKPFEVVLPQYNSPRTAIAVTSGTQILVDGLITGGATSFLAKNHSDTSDPYTGGLRPGDMFNFTDTGNINHKKVYRVVRTMDRANYLGTIPTAAQRRYYTVPSIEKNVADNMALVTTNPVFRVIQTGDTREYSLGTNNLYTFSLNLIEAQP